MKGDIFIPFSTVCSQVCRTIRKWYKASILPIIMLSAKGSAEAVAMGLESGANDYVSA